MVSSTINEAQDSRWPRIDPLSKRCERRVRSWWRRCASLSKLRMAMLSESTDVSGSRSAALTCSGLNRLALIIALLIVGASRAPYLSTGILMATTGRSVPSWRLSISSLISDGNIGLVARFPRYLVQALRRAIVRMADRCERKLAVSAILTVSRVVPSAPGVASTASSTSQTYDSSIA